MRERRPGSVGSTWITIDFDVGQLLPAADAANGSGASSELVCGLG
jgi:hypothetical protein